MQRERDERGPQGLVVVAGGGGFIGGHVVAELLAQGYSNVRAVDSKPVSSWFQVFPQVDNLELDLRDRAACREAMTGARRVFNFAADMGGMGFIETNKALCMLSSLVNTHLLLEAWEAGVERYFFSSSACVYAAEKQVSTDVAPLNEADAYPAMPEDGYGWEKLFGERMCRHFTEDFGIETRVARYHNVYGPNGTYIGGREKAPAAICRKVANAALTGEKSIQIWGDGEQTRSFTYVDDCVDGIARGVYALADGRVANATINLAYGQGNTLVRAAELIGAEVGAEPQIRFAPSLLGEVTRYVADIRKARDLLDWTPTVNLETGLDRTVEWWEKTNG